MSEIINRKYRTLFSVNILHHYFLDDGRTVFLFDASKNQPELKAYDVRDFLSIIPTIQTQQVLKNMGAICRLTSMGIVVAAPEENVFKKELEFVIVPTDPRFANYTALTLRGQKIEAFEYKEKDEIKRFRVKYNVFVFTNKGKTTRFLSEKIPTLTANQVELEAFFIANGKVSQIAHQVIRKVERNGEQTEEIEGVVDNIEKPINGSLPLFVNQEDIANQEITFLTTETLPDGGVVVVEETQTVQGVVLSENIPDNVFALLRIDPSTPHFNDPAQPPQFEVHFKSRSTYWRYFDKTTNGYKIGSPDFWSPLTLNGGRAGKRKATTEAIIIRREKVDDETFTLKPISEINP